MISMDTIISSRTKLSYQDEYDLMFQLHSLPTFVDQEYLQEKVLRGTLLATVVVTLIFCATIFVAQRMAADRDTVYYIAYKTTHFLGNTMIGIMGYYYYSTQIVSQHVSVKDIAVGFKDVLYPMACVQLGKNLWAIPAGLFHEEAILKMGHHVSVILVAIASCTFTMGFQYYVPLMFGVFELSSIPLAVMEIFKDFPEYQTLYPLAYTIVRLVFMFAFLYIRWFLFLPYFYDFLRLSVFCIVSYQPTSDIMTMIKIMACLAWMACFFLGALQIYWGGIIVRNFFKALIKKDDATKPSISINSTAANGKKHV